MLLWPDWWDDRVQRNSSFGIRRFLMIEREREESRRSVDEKGEGERNHHIPSHIQTKTDV